MLAEEILKAGAFIDGALQFIIAHATAALGRANADLLKGTTDGLGGGPVKRASRILGKARAFAVLDGRHNSRPAGLVAEADVEPGVSRSCN